jgi:hypothetical protein
MAKIPWVLAACLAIVCAVLSQKYSQSQRRNNELAGIVGLAASLEKQTNDLHLALAALQESASQETNRLVGLRIALLNSLEPGSKAQAVSIWDNEKQTGILVAHHLQPLSADFDYQLWILDPKYKTPVSAGIFQVDADGQARAPFKSVEPIGHADTFAVTVEKKGGAPTPTLKDLALIGS